MSTLKFVTSVWKSFQANSGLEPTLLNNLKILSAQPGVVKMELDIEKMHTNRLEILHGGVIASMTDLGGSLAVASKGLYSTGVSTDINISYLSSGGKVGDKISIHSYCDKFGKTLAFTKVDFIDEKKRLFARGSHTKYIALAHKDERNMTDKEESQ